MMDQEDREALEGEYKAMLRPKLVRITHLILDVLEAHRTLLGLSVGRTELLDEMEQQMPGILSRYQPEGLSREARTFQLELALEIITELRRTPQ